MLQILCPMREELVCLVHPLSLEIRKGLAHSRYMVNTLTEYKVNMKFHLISNHKNKYGSPAEILQEGSLSKTFKNRD